jgi:deoxyribose-phosphate aldolase
MRAACGDAHLKVIFGTGDLATLRNVMLASMVAMMAGADFIKTSTGKESVNATLPVGLAMVRAIRAYFEQTGYLIGFKPAGGISTAKVSLDWLVLMKEELGRPWLEPELFRFGASSLLDRHRAPARTPSDRTLFGQSSPRDGLRGDLPWPCRVPSRLPIDSSPTSTG